METKRTLEKLHEDLSKLAHLADKRMILAPSDLTRRYELGQSHGLRDAATLVEYALAMIKLKEND